MSEAVEDMRGTSTNQNQSLRYEPKEGENLIDEEIKDNGMASESKNTHFEIN